MSQGGVVVVFVKLEFWEVYWTAVALSARLFRKLLWVFGIMGTVWLLLLVMAHWRPIPRSDWQRIIQDDNRLMLVLLIPLLVVFVVPLLSTRKVLSDERVRRGVEYQFSDAGIHVESSVARSDLQWTAVREVIETRSAFLLLPTANVAHTIPRRCFRSEADLNAARDLFRMNIAKAKLRFA